MRLFTLPQPFASSLSRLLTLALSFSLAACGGGGHGTEQNDSLALVVDAQEGSDDSPGTANAPFRTITHALSVVAPGGVVQVRAGLYDSAHGEQFPLQLPQSVRLTGPASVAMNNRPMIVGAGLLPSELATNESATLVLGASSTVSDLHLMVPSGTSGTTVVIAAPFASATIQSCQVERGTFGVKVMKDAVGLTISYLHATGAVTGIFFDAAGHNTLVERSTVIGNAVGVRLFGVVLNLDLGGGSRVSEGLNVFAENDEADLYTPIGIIVVAQRNYWDGYPAPSEYVGRNAPEGIDIWRGSSTASVDTSGALSRNPAPR